MDMIFAMRAVGVISTHIGVGVVFIDRINGIDRNNSAGHTNNQEGWIQNLHETQKILTL
jgi:hypothetical protein